MRMRVLEPASGWPGILGKMTFAGDIFAVRGKREQAALGHVVEVAEVLLAGCEPQQALEGAPIAARIAGSNEAGAHRPG